MTVQFKLPNKRILPISDSPTRVVGEILKGALEKSARKINRRLAKLAQDAEEKLVEGASMSNTSPEVYLKAHLEVMAFLYLGCSTNLVCGQDIERGKDITSGTISIVLTKLADIIGPKVTQEILSTISYNVDAMVEEKFGKELIR